MVYVWEFEFFESGGYVNAWPCPPMEGGTFGDYFDDAVDSAVDWLSGMVDAHLTDGLELPERSLGHKPQYGGVIIAIAVYRELSDIRRRRVLAMEQTEYAEMTKDEMQRFIDQQMRDGRTWAEALERLAEIIGIKPTSVGKE